MSDDSSKLQEKSGNEINYFVRMQNFVELIAEEEVNEKGNSSHNANHQYRVEERSSVLLTLLGFGDSRSLCC